MRRCCTASVRAPTWLDRTPEVRITARAFSLSSTIWLAAGAVYWPRDGSDLQPAQPASSDAGLPGRLHGTIVDVDRVGGAGVLAEQEPAGAGSGRFCDALEISVAIPSNRSEE